MSGCPRNHVQTYTLNFGAPTWANRESKTNDVDPGLFSNRRASLSLYVSTCMYMHPVYKGVGLISQGLSIPSVVTIL